MSSMGHRTKQSEIALQRNNFVFVVLIAVPFNSYSFSNGIIASGKLCDCEYFLITALFICVYKNKRNLSEKIRVSIASNFFDFLQKIYCGFLKIDPGELK